MCSSWELGPLEKNEKKGTTTLCRDFGHQSSCGARPHLRMTPGSGEVWLGFPKMSRCLMLCWIFFNKKTCDLQCSQDAVKRSLDFDHRSRAEQAECSC